jgi:two-component system sensor histidine kinase UhpB
MKASSSPPLYVKVCLINGAVFAGAIALLVISPATVSPQVTASELAVLASGLAVIVATNAAPLHTTLAPLDRLVQLLDTFDASGPGRRLPSAGSGVAARLAQSFNDLLDRLDTERATRNVRELAVQEAERQRIAQELHDEVGQRLTVVLLGIQRALNTVPAEAAEELRLVQDNARTSLEEVRRVARGLRPGVLEDLGLVPALGPMVLELMAQTHLDVRRRFDHELITHRVTNARTRRWERCQFNTGTAATYSSLDTATVETCDRERPAPYGDHHPSCPIHQGGMRDYSWISVKS